MPRGLATGCGQSTIRQNPAIGIAIDGDSLDMIFDTGATVWLTPEALARMGDRQSAERGTSLIWSPVFDTWRSRHPEWRVIENADVLTKQPMIEVPVVSIGGYDVVVLDYPRATAEFSRPASR